MHESQTHPMTADCEGCRKTEASAVVSFLCCLVAFTLKSDVLKSEKDQMVDRKRIVLSILIKNKIFCICSAALCCSPETTGKIKQT